MEQVKPGKAVMNHQAEVGAARVESLSARMKKKREREQTPAMVATGHLFPVMHHQPPLQFALSTPPTGRESGQNTRAALLMPTKDAGYTPMLPPVEQQRKLVKSLAVAAPVNQVVNHVHPVSVGNPGQAVPGKNYTDPATGTRPLAQRYQSASSPDAELVRPDRKKNKESSKTTGTDPGLPAPPTLGERAEYAISSGKPLERKNAHKHDMLAQIQQNTTSQPDSKMTYSFRSWGKGHVDIDLRGQPLLQPSDDMVRHRLSMSLIQEGPARGQMSENKDQDEHSSRHPYDKEEEA